MDHMAGVRRENVPATSTLPHSRGMRPYRPPDRETDYLPPHMRSYRPPDLVGDPSGPQRGRLYHTPPDTDEYVRHRIMLADRMSDYSASNSYATAVSGSASESSTTCGYDSDTPVATVENSVNWLSTYLNDERALLPR